MEAATEAVSKMVIMASTHRDSPEDDGLVLCMLDSDAFGKVLEHIDGGARLAVWLTCKAFNKHRPVGKFTTSVCAVCANPAMFDWAVSIGLQPHRLSPLAAGIVLNALRYFGTLVHSIKLL